MGPRNQIMRKPRFSVSAAEAGDQLNPDIAAFCSSGFPSLSCGIPVHFCGPFFFALLAAGDCSCPVLEQIEDKRPCNAPITSAVLQKRPENHCFESFSLFLQKNLAWSNILELEFDR